MLVKPFPSLCFLFCLDLGKKITFKFVHFLNSAYLCTAYSQTDGVSIFGNE